MSTSRPIQCRNRLRDEGKVYPRSGCNACGDGGLRGCPHENRPVTDNAEVIHNLEREIERLVVANDKANQKNRDLIAGYEQLQDKYRTEQSFRADAERLAEKYRKCAVESQDWDWLAAREHADECGEDFFNIPAMQELYLIACGKEPTQ